MSDIYQDIWNADQAHAGLRAVRPGTAITADLRAHGYIIVNEEAMAGPDHRVIGEMHLPPGKKRTYDLARKLFNNYTLDQTKRENDFPEEHAEVQEFIEAIRRCPPMDMARAYVAGQIGNAISEDQWRAIIQRVWFERFDQGNNRDLSGFEHVIVGEQQRGKVQGYHCWYKYYLDERFRRDDADDTETDLIRFIEWKGASAGSPPDVVTLSYQWRAFDYEAEQFRTLTKPVGGFWVGPSIEGLMAIGTVRCLPEAMAPKRTIINGVKYNLPMYRSPNDRHLRTFYPEFAG